MTISETARPSISERVTFSLAAARSLLAAPPQPPARIRAAIERFEARSDKIVGGVQIAGVIAFAALYAGTYSSFDVHHAIEPAPAALALYGLITLRRLQASRRRKLTPVDLYASAGVDIVMLYVLIAAFPYQYSAPAALYLKAPTLLYVFMLIALRVLWFDPRLTLFTGALAAVGWALLAVISAVDGAPLTGDYRVYMTSLSLLPGAELEKIAAILAATIVLAIGVHRARTLLYRTATEETAASDLSKFVGRDAAARIRASDDGVRAGDGELRQAAIMMIDLRGFTIAASGMAPADVITLLKDYQARVLPLIERGGGSVDKFMGDGVLVSFGAAHVTGAECAQAVETAHAIIAAIDAWRAERAAAGLPPIDAAVALAEGEVVYGAIGYGDRLEYTVIGDAVNLAAKLEKHAKLECARIIATSTLVDRAKAQGSSRRALRLVPDAIVGGAPAPVNLAVLDAGPASSS